MILINSSELFFKPNFNNFYPKLMKMVFLNHSLKFIIETFESLRIFFMQTTKLEVHFFII